MQWEYFVVEHESPTRVRFYVGKELKYMTLADLGDDGWELCGIAGSESMKFHFLYFKRPKQ
jgi:hypothetical protein